MPCPHPLLHIHLWFLRFTSFLLLLCLVLSFHFQVAAEMLEQGYLFLHLFGVIGERVARSYVLAVGAFALDVGKDRARSV